MAGLSFLWAVADFTALLVNLFFAFSVQLPLYARVSAVYMPVVQIIILGQFMLYSYKPLTTRLLALLVCLLVWGTIIELELNFPESRDKIQWVAIALWSIETFPQVQDGGSGVNTLVPSPSLTAFFRSHGKKVWATFFFSTAVNKSCEGRPGHTFFHGCKKSCEGRGLGTLFSTAAKKAVREGLGTLFSTAAKKVVREGLGMGLGVGVISLGTHMQIWKWGCM